MKAGPPALGGLLCFSPIILPLLWGSPFGDPPPVFCMRFQEHEFFFFPPFSPFFWSFCARVLFFDLVVHFLRFFCALSSAGLDVFFLFNTFSFSPPLHRSVYRTEAVPGTSTLSPCRSPNDLPRSFLLTVFEQRRYQSLQPKLPPPLHP